MPDYNERHVIAVWGSPCSGKTTLAVNLAVVLADSGYMTCLISASDHGELQAFLGTAIGKNKGLNAALNSGRHVREALTEARPNLCILEQDTAGDAYDLDISPEAVSKILDELRDVFNFVIVDCTNYKEAVLTGMGIVRADKVVTCIPHRATAATWHIANKQMFEAIASKLLYVETDLFDGGCSMEQLLASIGLEECGLKLPMVKTAFLCENRSQPIVLTNGKAEKKYKEGVLTILRTILDLEAKERMAASRPQVPPIQRQPVNPNPRPQQMPRQQPNGGYMPPNNGYPPNGVYPPNGRPSMPPTQNPPQPQGRPIREYFVPPRQSTDGIRVNKPSKRAQRKAEEEAVRQAQQQRTQQSNALRYGDDDR